MTRDIDVVMDLKQSDAGTLIDLFKEYLGSRARTVGVDQLLEELLAEQ